MRCTLWLSQLTQAASARLARLACCTMSSQLSRSRGRTAQATRPTVTSSKPSHPSKSHAHARTQVHARAHVHTHPLPPPPQHVERARAKPGRSHRRERQHAAPNCTAMAARRMQAARTVLLRSPAEKPLRKWRRRPLPTLALLPRSAAPPAALLSTAVPSTHAT